MSPSVPSLACLPARSLARSLAGADRAKNERLTDSRYIGFQPNLTLIPLLHSFPLSFLADQVELDSGISVLRSERKLKVSDLRDAGRGEG